MQNTYSPSLSTQYCRYLLAVLFCGYGIQKISSFICVLHLALQSALSAFILCVGTRWRCISVVFWTWQRLELRSHPADHFHHHSETEKRNLACQQLFWILCFLAGILYLVLESTYGVSVSVLHLVLYCCILYLLLISWCAVPKCKLTGVLYLELLTGALYLILINWSHGVCTLVLVRWCTVPDCIQQVYCAIRCWFTCELYSVPDAFSWCTISVACLSGCSPHRSAVGVLYRIMLYCTWCWSAWAW